MPKLEITPYFHPTQAVLIDDDIDFLGNLSLQLDTNLAYLLFDSTRKALSYLNERGQDPAGTLQNNVFCEATPTRKNAPDTLAIDTEALRRKMLDPHRFARTSVVLVDYAMPEMNGLDFCQRINDPHIKKILFTGVATESVAVDAFNQGLIDQYIRKQEYSVYELLDKAISQYQRDYLRSSFVHVADVFGLEFPDLLAEPDSATLIETLRRDYGLVEYYMVCNPFGFLFADADGQVKRVVIQDARQCELDAEQARQAGVSAACIDKIGRGEIIMPPERLTGDDSAYSDWKVRSQPAEVLAQGASRRFWAVFDASIDGENDLARPSYNQFLEWLDAVGYSMM
jgi:CheY-like chemotaxis protein